MRKVQIQYWQGVGAVLTAGTGYACMSILLKDAYQLGLGPIQVIALQSWVASLILFCYVVFFKREVFKISGRMFYWLALQGVVGAMGTSLLYAYALMFLQVSVAILLLYLYPAVVLAAGAFIWHKKIGKKEMTAFFLTMGGTTLASGVFSGLSTMDWAGILLGLAAAVAYAVFNLVGDVVLAEVAPLTAMCYSQWVCAVSLFVVSKGEVTGIPWQNIKTWEVGLLLATVASIIPFYMILVGIKRLGSDYAAILSTFELPMTFVLAAIFLREFPTPVQWIGGGFVLIGILLLNWRSKKDEETSNKERSNLYDGRA
ncbi:DMT(drug/metabolite transporter) superfamily permease [Desulfosporosinus acidiphilus SJ4]|uniref:DMT(Drug/metabolite transporter) superfamily permease n=1 Tax=Desulfosporosinus acidiphilus (strain DSM 22704 / JCM 16185 / SJ4) TaxID=646529 RepID=I4D205_DESAJ|nr:DMT family transporter [Desulfosporosinus acidiphilus]AFM39829.1 DMT(drug/metabolite transporter) superfamily permease [Desulfosporosinus acidiphilus SJ4]